MNPCLSQGRRLNAFSFLWTCVLLSLINVGLASSSPNVSPAELTALLDLYISTDGINWLWRNSSTGSVWDFTVPDPNPCSPVWQGVTCICLNNCSIQQLELSDYGLFGSLPNAIDNLYNLTLLDLSDNNLDYSIPKTIGGISNLLSLNLENNSLTGYIPKSLSNLQYLTSLNLTDNYLEGTIPSFVYNFTSLQFLEVGRNKFHGPISRLLGNLGETLLVLNLNNNDFTGTIPESVSSLINLDTFQLSYNFFNGSIPSAVCNLSSVINFDLSHNRFTGTIPPCIGNLSSLETLSLANNYDLTGVIPACIVSLNNSLINLKLSYNKFTGTIDVVYQLTNLKILYLSRNRFSGFLTDGIGGLANLVDLELSYNNFTGSIPESVGNLIRVNIFEISYNGITGVIPLTVCSMSIMFNLDLQHNKLVGAIPECLGNVSRLTKIFLNDNNLTGSIPDCLVLLNRSLEIVEWYNNGLTGSIPPNLLNASGSVLRIFDVSNNSLTGLLPPIMLHKLFAFNIQSNLISGSLHSSLSQCSELGELLIGDNRLTGPFPSLIGMKALNTIDAFTNQLTGCVPIVDPIVGKLSVYSLDNNHFTGTVPDLVCNTSVQYFSVTGNYLQGAYPICVLDSNIRYFSVSMNYFSGSTGNQFDKSTGKLEFFDCSYNKLTGKLPVFSGGSPRQHLTFYYVQNNLIADSVAYAFDVLNSTSAIEYLDVSNNLLYGKIPDVAALARSVKSFAMGSNCLTGPIPPVLCESSNLLFLDLDGVATAESCRTLLFPGINFLNSYFLKNQMTGGIPDCLFQLPLLETLHLSGNGIVWSFPSDFNVTPALTDLTLSHNRITGDIPQVIQKRQWKNLDLSYNKLSGILSMIEQTDDAASIVLQVNRLSGNVPDTLLNLRNINILNGNIFNCGLQRSQLPLNDPDYATYQCGSNAFNEAIIVWGCFCLSCAVVAGIAVFCHKYWHRQFVLWFKHVWTIIGNWYSVVQNLLSSFFSTTLILSQSIIALTVLIVVVFLPLYTVLKVYYGTVLYQYAWTVSAAYLSGEVPAIILMVAYIGVISCMYAIWYRQSIILSAGNGDVNSVTQHKFSFGKTVVLSLVVLINSIVMVIVNGAYVFVVVNYNTNIIFGAQISIALFKLLWNDYALTQMIIMLGVAVNCDKSESLLMQNTSNLVDDPASLPYLSFIVLFNSIVAPCLATAAVDSNCFLNAFIAPATVSTEFPSVTYLGSCPYNSTVYHLQCSKETTSSNVVVSYDPPFTYSYQCSSAILTNYASVYVFMFLMVAFLKPLTLSTLMYLHGKCSEGNWYKRLIGASLAHQMKPASEKDLIKNASLFKKEAFVLRAVSKLAVFATFGVVFPILTVVICVAFISEVCFNLLVLGRYISGVDNEDLRNQIAKRMGQDCEGCWDLLLQPLMTLVIPFAAFFYAFFVFDIYGDAVGYKRALWAPAVVTAYPWILRLVQKVVELFLEKISDESEEIRETELNPL